MTVQEIANLIKGIMTPISSIGVVSAFEPYTRDVTKLREYFVDPVVGYLLGWSISRASTVERHHTTEQVLREHNMVIRGYRAVSDDGGSGAQMQDLVESICNAIRGQNDARFSDQVQDVGLPQVRTVEPRLFGDTLIHYAEIGVRITDLISVH